MNPKGSHSMALKPNFEEEWDLGRSCGNGVSSKESRTKRHRKYAGSGLWTGSDKARDYCVWSPKSRERDGVGQGRCGDLVSVWQGRICVSSKLRVSVPLDSYESSQSDTAKLPTPGSSHKSMSSQPGGESKIQVSTGLVPFEALLQVACVHPLSLHVCVKSPVSYKSPVS